MGGGDLNLKKSWHPSTLRNIERVWKAEQKHEAEKQKIEQLQKELAEERAREEIQAYAEDQGVIKKKDERLDWMYQGPAAMVNREDYLLGRKIDKTFELLQQAETGVEPQNDDDCNVKSIFDPSASGNATVDLANKIREDPLFSIMKKEKEQKKNLLTNPIKMKQLQKMLQASLEAEKTKKSKKEKKKRKSDENDLDGERHKKQRHRHEKPSRVDSESENDEQLYKRKHKKHRHSSGDESLAKTSRNHRENSSSSVSHKMDSDYSHHKYRSSDDRSHKDGHKKDHYSSKYKRQEDNTNRKKQLDAEERARRLQEMQDNAKWREEQRKRNTDRYKEEDEREDAFERVQSSDFLKPVLSKAAGKANLENRVKQKIFTIQRNSSDMDKHFARR